MRSFVIGNGNSRKQIPLNELKQYGATYGCNALYRDFEPDYLVAVDLKMIEEINESGYQDTHQVWINPYPQTRKFQNFNYFTPRLGWSSGPSALFLATKHCPKEIFILGFDYVGRNGKVNNVYADTNNYRKSDEIATYFGNWEKQTEQVITKNPHILYYRVIDRHNYYSLNFNCENYKELYFEDFDKLKSGWNFKNP